MLSYGFVEHLVDVVVGGAHGIVLNEASLGVKKYEAGMPCMPSALMKAFCSSSESTY